MIRVAYFSMEMALRAELPTYSGGLGVLAGDTLRSAADLNVPMAGVTLLYRNGYFSQRLDAGGRQHEHPLEWSVEEHLKELASRVTVQIEGRAVALRAWQYEVQGLSGFTVPVYFLDADVPENTPEDRALTHTLYGGDQRYRLCQEALLGIGGVRMLRALGHAEIERFHLNDGHASLLIVELLRQAGAEVDAVRARCVFTTHTPVPAGHDEFAPELVTRVLGPQEEFASGHPICSANGMLNMTELALSMSRYVNGVAKKHGEVSREMFAGYAIDAITNGVHAATWTSPPFQALFDRYIPDWREDNFTLRNALAIPRADIWAAHTEAKQRLIDEVNRRSSAQMDVDVFTLGFARRAAQYKRADLLFHDETRLQAIAAKVGSLQIVYAGKAHPHDEDGKALIQRIVQLAKTMQPRVRAVYLEDYDMALGRLVTAGVEVWLNTPQPPMEASGTSGMKAALNGVPSLSVLDGWWIEGCIEDITGWAIDSPPAEDQLPRNAAEDAAALYDKLDRVILPLFTTARSRFIDVMRQAIALNGSFFNTQRMLQQYVVRAYFR